MSCNHCSTKFNFFHKEMGCSNCGLSFCNKCLKQKCKIPNKGTSEYPVCKTCYQNLTTDANPAPQTNIPPPDVYLKEFQISLCQKSYFLNEVLHRRLEALENPVAPPITMYKHDEKLQRLRTGLSPADQQLIDRLEKLKDDKNKVAPPSEDEIRKRLNSLKGENEYVEGPSRAMFTADTRSDQEKADALLDMFMSEKAIELAQKPEDDIEARIATLREQGVRPNEGPYISNLHDSSGSEEEIDKITRKIMDEVALEEKCPNLQSKQRGSQSQESNEEKDNSSPELPWCVLCNKDAQFRCLDCDDLYCAECSTEVHKNWGETDHRVIQYKQK